MYDAVARGGTWGVRSKDFSVLCKPATENIIRKVEAMG